MVSLIVIDIIKSGSGQPGNDAKIDMIVDLDCDWFIDYNFNLELTQLSGQTSQPPWGCEDNIFQKITTSYEKEKKVAHYSIRSALSILYLNSFRGLI